MDKLNYRDFFDFDDNTPLSEAVKMIDKLQNVYSAMVKSVAEDSNKLNSELEGIREEAKKMLKSVEGLNSTFEGNQKAIIENAQASKALVTQNDKLKKSHEENNKTLTKLQQGVETLNKSKQQLAKTNLEEAGSLNDLKKRLKEAENAYKSLGANANDAIKEEQLNRVKELSTQYNELNKSLNQAKKSAGAAAGSYNELNQFVLEGRKRLKSMEGGLEGNSQEFQQLQKEVKEARDRLAEWDKAIGDNFRNVGNYESALDGLEEKFAGLGGAISNPMGALGGFAKSIPIPQVAAFAGAVTGLVAGMDELAQITNEVKGQMRDTANLTGLAGDELQQFASGVRGTAAAFGKEYNEVLVSANVLMKEFGLTGQQSLDEINRGFIAGADINGEFIDQIKEYSTQFKAAGLEASDLINIITTSTQQGIFSDKGADTIKEAGLRLREMTVATKDALEPLGQARTEQIAQAIEAGETFEAIQLVSKGLKEVDLSAQQTQTIIADVFGGAGEDAGLDFILGLEAVQTGLDETTEGLNKYQKAQLELLEAEQELAASEVALSEALASTTGGFKTFGIQLKSLVLDTVVALLNSLKPLKNAFFEVWDNLSRIGDAFAGFNDGAESSISFMDILTTLFNFLTIPMRLVAQLWVLVTDAIADFIESSPVAIGLIDDLKRGFELFTLVLENTPAIFAGFLNAAKVALSGIKELVIDTFSNVGDIIAAAFDPTESVSDVIARTKDRFKEYGDEVGNAFKEGFLAQKKKEKEDELALEAERAAELEKTVVKEAAARSQKETDALKKEAEKRAKELAEKAKKAAEARLAIFRMEQEEIIRINEAIVADSRSSLDEQLISAENAAQARINIANAEKDALLANADLLAIEREAIEKEYAGKVAEIQRDLSDELAVIMTENFQQQFEMDQMEIDTQALDDLTEINRQFREGEIKSLEEFEQAKLQVQEESQLRLLENQLNYLQQRAEQLREAGYDTTQIERDIADTQLAIAEAKNDGLIAKEKELQNQIQNLKQSAFDSALTIIENLNEAEDAKRERDLEKLEEQQEKELEAAEGNEEREAAIKEKFAAEKERINREQAKADRKRAIFEKALAATNIAVNTAQAVIKAVAASPLTGGLPFSAIVAAIGAVQLAAVLSKPIPQFAEGTGFSPEGWAIINEEGPEIRERAGKREISYSEGPMLTYLERGTKIYDADTSEKMMKQAEYEAITRGYNDGSQIVQVTQSGSTNNREVVSSIRSLEHTMKNKKELHINISKKAVEGFTKKGEYLTKLLNTDFY